MNVHSIMFMKFHLLVSSFQIANCIEHFHNSPDLPNLQRIQLNRFAMEGSGNETRRSREVIPYNYKNVLIMKGMVEILAIE